MDPLALGTVIVTTLTELASRVATKLGANLPPIIKQGIALAIATGFSFGFLHVATPLPNAINALLTDLLIWFWGMVLHDKALRPAV